MAAGTKLGTAYVQIRPTAEGIKGSISDVLDPEAQAAGTSAGTKIGSFAKKALVGLGIGAAFYALIKGSLDEGAKLQQSYLGGLDTLYGDAADSVREYAREASKYGVSMNDYSEQAVSFGAALKSAYGGDTHKAMEAANLAIMDMADNSAKMGTDISSVQQAYQGFAKGQYTLLDNLKLGYGGTKTEMERLLTDAEKLTGVKYDINNLGDVYQAIHVIQGELGLTGVAAEEASQTFSGSFNAMKASLQNLLGSLALGEDIKPALQNLARTVSTFFFNNLIPLIGTILKSLPGAIVTFVKEGVPLMMAGISDLLSGLIAQLKEKADGVTATKVAQWATTTIPKLLSAAGQLIKKFASALITNLPQIIKALGRIGVEIIKGLGSALWGKVSQAANTLKDKFLAPINAMKDRVKAIIDKIRSFFPLSVGRIFSNIKLPHFRISGGTAPWGIGGLGEKPTIGIDWYDKGGIFTNPQVIGVAERRPEFVGALDDLRKIVREETGNGVTINVYASEGMDVKALAEEVERRMVTATRRRNLAWQ